MRSVLSVVVIVAVGVGAAHAAPRAAHPQPTMSTTLDPIEVEGLKSPDGDLETSRAGAQAHQDAFDRRIARSSKRAIGSICSGCTGRVASAKARPPTARAMVADAEAGADDGPIVDKADEAPAY